MRGLLVLSVAVGDDSEIVGNHFGYISFIAILVFPRPGLQLAFNIYLCPFAQNLLGNLCQ